jgi:ATP-dependent DNA helicase DinG
MNALLEQQPNRLQSLALPASMWVAGGKVHLLTPDGELRTIPVGQAAMELHKRPVLVCHAPYMRQKLGGAVDVWALDILELFAFVHPAVFCVPTPAGVARALGLATPQATDDAPLVLMDCAKALLGQMAREPRTGKKADPLEIARVMGLNGKGWAWTPFIFAAYGEPYDPAQPVIVKTALNIWKHLPEWAEGAPPAPPSHHPVTGDEARARLKETLNAGSEDRPQQAEYATTVTAAFAPMVREGAPHIVLAEAGTGTGKTLGYLAPASVWAEKNGAPVWISTYTKNLQRQVGQELSRLYPDPMMKDKKAVIRKGRENYLCLLNFEDMAAGAALAKYPDQVIAAGLMARWAGVSENGDMHGGDFPGWLAGLLGHKNTHALSDKRGECIYAACDHYHRCFAERSVKKAQRVDIVVANHALVMIQTADAAEGQELPKRYVFDEGHHLFDAADSAFAGHLTALETRDMRRWLLGHENAGKSSRARGLKKRIEDLIAGDAISEAALQAVQHAAQILPKDGWTKRLKDSEPFGKAEEFLHGVYKQVYARADHRDSPYSIETQTRPLIDGVLDKASDLKDGLKAIQKPLTALTVRLRKKLAENAETLGSDERKRIESVATGLNLRSLTLAAWIGMLETLEQGDAPEEFIDWMEIERIDGKAFDVGLYRHYVDPMIPFAAALKPHAHGVVVTSATLRGTSEDAESNWAWAERRSGTKYLSGFGNPPPLSSPLGEGGGVGGGSGTTMIAVPSPFDYAAQTKIYVVNDVRKDNMDQVAAAYRVLFEAASGGALGLFTAIQRLRGVHDRIAAPLEKKGLNLYAQHIDAMDNGTLVDIFREDTHACLLGTDAVRDGVDVPGESLRLLVYDRVPWSRPTILYKARREAFGGKIYDEEITRMKLRQAYGRLIRRNTDRGVFVMLDQMLPSRLCTAFPEGVEVERMGLADVVQSVRQFLKSAE